MNFLAHFYTGKNHHSSHFKTGLVLPDLTRNYSKAFKIKEEHTRNQQQDVNLIHLNDGVKHHLSIDATFHNSKFFQNSMIVSNEIFKENNFSASDKYLYFVSHVLLELLIDRYLINKDASICDEFYDSLQQVKNDELSQYLSAIGIPDTEAGFVKFVDMFKEVQYTRHYNNNERLVFALNRIYLRATGKELENDKHLIYRSIEEIEDKINEDIPRILSDLTVSPELFK
jgi:hypothetical protein